MGKTATKKEAEKHVLEELGNKASMSKKELKKIVKAKDPNLMKSQQGDKVIKKVLRKLEKKGKIKKDGKVYSLIVSTQPEQYHQEQQPTTMTADNLESDSKQWISSEIPIAVRMRMMASTKSPKDQPTKKMKTVTFTEPQEQQIDLDEEIRRLEMELEKSESSSSSSSESSDDDDNFKEENGTPGILSLSKYANDRVEHLPAACLPKPGRYKARDDNTNNNAHNKVRLSKPRTKDKKDDENEQEKTTIRNGLKQAVQEVLEGYKARSSEKLPFYCRFCAKQYPNETEFLQHKQSEFHETAVAMERKATYCRLCRKQLTSPAQMKEHLSSKPHKERLLQVRTKHQGHRRETTFNPNNSQNQGKKNHQNHHGFGASQRQWVS